MPDDEKNLAAGNPETEKPALRVNPSGEGSGPAAYLRWKGEISGRRINTVDFQVALGNDRRGYLDDSFSVMFVGPIKDWPFKDADPREIARDRSHGLNTWMVVAVSGSKIKISRGQPMPRIFTAELIPESYKSYACPESPDIRITPVWFLDEGVLEKERAKAKQAYERTKHHRP
ncbi:hypothetical protein KGQ24_02315 [Patescibacteria group bacterium]|nr:hypothetical protein [Patescibacteria group bacterium]